MLKHKKRNWILICVAICMLFTFVYSGSIMVMGASSDAKVTNTTDITKDLIFHDQATYFISNIEPDVGETVTIRLRAVKNLLLSAEVEYCVGETGLFTGVSMSRSDIEFDSTGRYEYWEAEIEEVPEGTLYYRFKLTNYKINYSFYQSKRTVYYYSHKETDYYQDVSSSALDYTHCWKIKSGFSTPDWAKGMTWYSLMPDAFFNGDPTNDDHDSDGNYDQPWNMTHNGLTDRYGGDLQGVMSKVDYIKDLGVQGVCYNPITSCVQNGGYGTYDQNQIESTFGNAQTYSDFISLMHNNNLKLVQDVAIYHTIRDSIYYNQSGRWPVSGYAQGESSPYYNMILQPIVEAWSGVVLNNASDDAKEALWSTEQSPLARYVNESLGYGVDGYRFDCGGDITGVDKSGNTVDTAEIMVALRNRIKSINSEAVVISEYSNPSQLNAGAWDGRWELNLGNELRRFAKGETDTFFNFRNYLENTRHSLLRGTVLCSHNQLTTHDLYGAIYQDGNEHQINAAKLLQMTVLGSPSIYYGEEINYAGRQFESTEGRTEGFSSFDWDESKWDYEVLNYHKALIELRNSYTALKDGAFCELRRPTSTDGSYYSFGRFDEKGAVVTYVNITETATTGTVDVSRLGVANGTIMTDWFTGKQYIVQEDGTVTMDVPAGGTVLVTGECKSSYTLGESAVNINSSVFDYASVILDGQDVTDDYLSNSYIQVGESSCVKIGNVDLSENNSFVISADYTFDALEDTIVNDNIMGIALGECFYNNATYKVGGVLRPYLSGGSQGNTCLVKGVGDSNSEWLRVWGGPSIDKGNSNTVNMKVSYDNGIIRFYMNDVLMGTMDDLIDIQQYSAMNFAPFFFNYSIPFTLSNIQIEGDVKDKNTDTIISDGTVTITTNINNSSTINTQEDHVKFINNPVFHNYSYSTYVGCDSNAEIAVMARNSLDADSIFYAALMNDTSITIVARETKGAIPVVVANVEKGNTKYIKIERNSNNEYITYLGTGSDSSISYNVVNASKKFLSMDTCNYVGVSVLKGQASFRSLETKENSRTLYDDFNGVTVTSLLSGMENSSAIIQSGMIEVMPGDILCANAFDDDWTFKAKLEYTPVKENDYAGVICKQDENTFIAAGRIKISDEQKIFFAKSSDGELVIEYLADDSNASSDVIVQLQRIGSTYTAVYSYDGVEWHLLGDGIFFNMSAEYPGITVAGTTSAKYDYVSFGDSINDQSSFNTPRTPGKEIDLSGGKYNQTYSLKVMSGVWTNVAEGLHQSENGIGQLSVKNVIYDSFRAEATLELQDDGLWAGMNFGKTSYDSSVSDGYLIKYTSNGELILEKDGVEIDSCPYESDSELVRVVVECSNERIKVYAGQNATLIMNIVEPEYCKGYFSYCTNGPASIKNYNVGAMNMSLYSNYTARGYDDKLVIYNSNNTEKATAYLRGYAYTDFIMSSTITLHIEDETKTASAGVILTGAYGVAAEPDENIQVIYGNDGTLRLVKNGVDLCDAYTLVNAPTSIEVMVVKQGGRYSIYVNNNIEPVLQYTEAINTGGVVSFFSVNSTTEFANLRIDDIAENEDYTKRSLYTDWVQQYQEKSKTHIEDFSSAGLIESNYLSYDGEWEISNGTLHTISHSRMEAGVTYVGNEYKDFELTFKMKRSSEEANPGFGGISFRKLSPKDRYDESGITLAFYTHTIQLIKKGSANITTGYTGDCTSYVFEPDVWHNIKVVCEDEVFQVYSDETLIFEGVDNEYGRGYITFRSGITPVEYDDIKIVSLDSVPEELTSANYKVDKDYISAVPTNTTVNQFLSNINERRHVKVFKDGNEVAYTDIIGTGMTVSIMDGNSAIRNYAVIVMKDVDGDGQRSAADASAVKSHLLKESILSPAAILAADINGDNEVTISDYFQYSAENEIIASDAEAKAQLINSKDKISAGDTFTVEFQLEGKNIYGVTGSLIYDDSQLSLISVMPQVSEPWKTEIVGERFMAYDSTMSSAINNKSILFTAEFVVNDVAPGTNIDISCINIIASNGVEDIYVEAVSCSKSVSGSVLSCPTNWAAEKILPNTFLGHTETIFDLGNMKMATENPEWTYTGTFSYDSLLVGNPGGLHFIFGKGKYNGSERYLAVTARPYTNELGEVKGAQVVAWAGVNSDGALYVAGREDAIYSTNRNYNFKVTIRNGKLSFWIDDTKFVDNLDLLQNGVSEIVPQFGVHPDGTSGKISNIVVSGDFDTTVTVENDTILTDLKVTEKTGRMFYDGITYGDTYYHLANVQNENSDGNIRMVIGTCDEGTIEAYYQNGKAYITQHSNDSDTVLISKEIMVNISNECKYEMEYTQGILSFWVNDILVIRHYNLLSDVSDFVSNAGIASDNGRGLFCDILLGGNISKQDGIIYQKLNDITPYREGTYTYMGMLGYVFAGWYSEANETLSIASNTTSGEAYAKLVPEQVLTVKVQLGIKPYDQSKRDMRLVATVDSSRYSEVGFYVNFKGKTICLSDTTVYGKLSAYANEKTWAYTPSYFHDVSRYFFTYVIANIGQSNYDEPFQMVPYWKTLDGTEVMGQQRCLAINWFL